MESEDISTACEWKYRGATSSEAVGGYESENDITEKMGISLINCILPLFTPDSTQLRHINMMHTRYNTPAS